jgi:hypothetical protein
LSLYQHNAGKNKGTRQMNKTAIEKASEIWHTKMNLEERYSLTQKFPYEKSITKAYRAIMKYLIKENNLEND